MRRTLLISLAAAAALTTAAGAQATPPGRQMTSDTYAVIGDTPYTTGQIQNFPNDVAELNAAPDVSRVLHLGDIKSGSTKCLTSDADPATGDYTQILSAFGGFEDPLVYTPGDNEWTDCHRINNGGFTPTERLATLRSMFFADPGLTLGQHPATVDAQDGYPENVTWSASRVQFAVVDLPGSNNDWLPWFSQQTPGATQTQEQIDEVTNRTAADIAWIKHVFAAAKASKAKAVLIGIQADMWDPAFGTTPAAKAAQSDHYTSIIHTLASQSLSWDRKVLLMNGDSHAFEVDHPLADPTTVQNQVYGLDQSVPNLERVTVNGSDTACHEWLELHIDPRSDAVFSWDRHLFANQPGAYKDAATGATVSCPRPIGAYPHQ
jgi:hypothetical protein